MILVRPTGIFQPSMVVVSVDRDAKCPVVKEWLKIDALVSRPTAGKIALCTSSSIDPTTVADKHELLTPLLTIGALLAKKVVWFSTFSHSNK